MIRSRSLESLTTRLVSAGTGILFDEDEQQKFDDESASVTRVDQQTGYYCGAACCVMVLTRYSVVVDQASAYLVIHNEDRFQTEKLYSDPEGMRSYLVQRLPPGTFIPMVISTTSYDDAFNEFLQSIGFLRAPCIALVNGGYHWVVVDTVRVIEGISGTKSMVGVLIQNPAAGSTPESYIDLSEFKSNWLTPNQFGQTWKQKIVVVGGSQLRGSSEAKVVDLLKMSEIGSRPLDIGSSKSGLITTAIQRMLSSGFVDIREISGGGAPVTKPIAAFNEADQLIFWVVPVDATQDHTFSDFCYCALDSGTGALLEVARMEAALDILNDTEVSDLLRGQFPNEQIKVRPNYYWIDSFRVMSRFDLVRIATIGTRSVAIYKGGVVRAYPEASPLNGG